MNEKLEEIYKIRDSSFENCCYSLASSFIAKKLLIEYGKSEKFESKPAGNYLFSVSKPGEKIRVVNVSLMNCTCLKPVYYGYPCCHILSVLNQHLKKKEDYFIIIDALIHPMWKIRIQNKYEKRDFAENFQVYENEFDESIHNIEKLSSSNFSNISMIKPRNEDLSSSNSIEIMICQDKEKENQKLSSNKEKSLVLDNSKEISNNDSQLNSNSLQIHNKPDPPSKPSIFFLFYKLYHAETKKKTSRNYKKH